MSSVKLKSNLHQENKNWWGTISAREKVAIEEELKDIENGDVFSYEEVMKEIRAEFPI